MISASRLNLIKRPPRPQSSFRDLAGKISGKLTVIELAGFDARGVRVCAFWLCKCECGNTILTDSSKINLGRKTHCGCARPPRYKKHGESFSVEYRRWTGMKTRCNPRYVEMYPNHAGRGIKVCDGMSSSYAAFLRVAGRVPDPSLDLDRKDNSGNYSCGQCEECLLKNWPMNIRWVTRTENNRNKRTCIQIEYNGKTQSLLEWAVEVGKPRYLLALRLRYGWTVQRALMEPARTRRIKSVYELEKVQDES